MVGYTDQSADALWLTLADGELDTRQFSVLSEASYNAEDGSVLSVGIIGASHFLSIHANGKRFTEVFACIPEVRTERTLERFPLHALVDRTVELPLHRYRFTAQAVPWDRGLDEREALLDQIRSARSGNGELGLSFTFPDSPSAPPAFRGKAQTAVWVQVTGHRILVRTLHAYPETTMVFTTSTGEINR